MEGFDWVDRLALYAASVVIGGGTYIGFKTDQRLEYIEEKIEKPKHEIREENVIGEDSPEKFYEIDGKRVYLEIDGKPVEQHFRE